MDVNLKQWRDQQYEPDHHQEQTPPAKLPRLHLLDPQYPSQQQPPSGASALPLFVTEPTSSKLSSNLSAYPPDHSATSTKFPRMGSYFSLAQWQELELQALIFRHMLAGAAVPPELLHLVKKSFINSSHPYYLPHPFQHYPHLQPALLQSGYWGRASMDPEPGRCRRTDGKKWRCSRDVVAGQKYCERHMHRGRNRSRKPVEIPTPTTCNGGGVLKTSSSIAAQPMAAMASGGGGTHYFAFSGPTSPSIDLLHLSHRPSESMVETPNDVTGDDKSSGQILRHFFDDWPRSLQESDNAGGSSTSSVTSSTNISISDFSLKLSTGDGNDSDPQAGGNAERQRNQQSNWGATWAANQVTSMGGPLAEALRSSNSSPTSVLHRLPRASTSEASYIST